MSRELQPKQFLPLVGEHTLFQQTLLRVASLGARARAPIVVCNEAHRELVARQASDVGIDLAAIVVEPLGRNTAPAVAAVALAGGESLDRDALLLVLPADHVVADVAAFVAAVNAGVEAASAGFLVTFGVVPDRPETGYGYILKGENRGAWSRLDKFVEKPDLPTAAAYVESGRYLWNSGMFLFSAQAFLDELGRQAPAMLEVCRESVADAVVANGVTTLGARFRDCPANSIDYAVMEGTRQAAVVPLSAGWSDVGSWPALHDVSAKDAAGNTTSGHVVLETCANTYVTASGRLVAAVGLRDTVIVETPDAVLVMARSHAQDVKKVVDELKRQGLTTLLEKLPSAH